MNRRPIALLAAVLIALLAAAPAWAQPKAAKAPATRPAVRKTAPEDPVVARKYADLVAALPADEQAWERTLQENLGSFYLPIHKRTRVQGRSSCWDFVRDDPKLPRVLLIGDSISGGYTLGVRKALAGKANVHKAPENCGPTANGIKKLDIWLGKGKWDVIHFNFGLHDSRTPKADYEKRLREILARLQKTGAKIVWASTTPRPADGKEGPVLVQAVVERNAVAAAVMQENHIPVNDLFTFITPHLKQTQRPGDVHFNSEGYALLGKQVAEAIEAAMK